MDKSLAALLNLISLTLPPPPYKASPCSLNCCIVAEIKGLPFKCFWDVREELNVVIAMSNSYIIGILYIDCSSHYAGMIIRESQVGDSSNEYYM